MSQILYGWKSDILLLLLSMQVCLRVVLCRCFAYTQFWLICARYSLVIMSQHTCKMSTLCSGTKLRSIFKD